MTSKITVTVPDELIDDARRAVESGRARSVSAYVSAAMATYQRRQTLGELLEEWEQELGPTSPESRTWAEREIARVAGDPVV